jgi:predicted nucleotidyltransferase
MRNSVQDLARKFDCVLIYLFGSQAEGGKRFLEGEEIRPDAYSDLDVAVAFRNLPTGTIKIYGEIYKEISEIFNLFNIDLIFIQEMSPLFQYEIIKGVRIYEGDERIAEEFEEGVMKKAEDLTFKKRILDLEIMEAIEDGYFEFEYRANP